MKNTTNFTSRYLELSMDDLLNIQPVAYALSSELRLRIIESLSERRKNINELARELDAPVSTISTNISILEQGGLVVSDVQPGKRGMMKICSKRLDQINISLVSLPEQKAQTERVEMPIGGFSKAGGINPTCGMADFNAPYDIDDDPQAFYDPRRFGAQILWMREGWLEYHMPLMRHKSEDLDFIEISFEACSEVPGHRNNWPSDIFVEVNGCRLGVWHCPGDMGGRRGLLNPQWWNDDNTQYGFLKTWRVNKLGSWLENDFVGSTTLDDLQIGKENHISLCIGVVSTPEYSGGINLFGEKFGDYPQGIVMTFGFRS